MKYNMDKVLIKHLTLALKDNIDLAKHLPEEAFSKKLPVRSNSIANQYYCLVGTREWYKSIILTGRWSTWKCTTKMEECNRKQDIIKCLNRTAREVGKLVKNIKLDDRRRDMILFLIKHETLHLGQLVRYIYGLKYKFPKSIAKRWALPE